MPSSTRQKDSARQEFADRLQQSLLRSGRTISPGRLATEFNAHFHGTGVHAHSCRKWLQGEAIPTQEKLVTLAYMLGVSADWLRYGQETQLLERSRPQEFTTMELAMVADYRQLDDRDRKVVRNLVGLMLRTQHVEDQKNDET